MRSLTLCSSCVLLILLAVAGRSQPKVDPNVAATPHRTPEEERKLFRLPPGFEIQLVAAEPDIHKPLNLAFDDRGRLWVTDTLEYPFPPPPGKKSRDSVKILEDFADNGRARKITTFAEGLVIPIGVIPLPAAQPQDALVFSIPTISRLRDRKGSGHADDKQVMYSEYGRRDTHGLTGSFTWGFDGWIYACHGFSNESTIKAKDGSTITMRSGNTYRMRPDGSHIEQFTHGQVNPFGLSFDPLGNLYSADCHTQPIYQLLRGAWYPSFGTVNDGLGLAPEMYNGYTESTAVAGIAYYAADHYPKAYRDSAFVGDVISHRVNQFAIEWHGSSPKGVLKRFLECDDPWFRPNHIQLGPDGALYIADFYNRIIGHYEVPLTHPGRDRTSGRIWRIVYRGDQRGTPAPRTDWTTAGLGDLIKDLGHPNLSVRFKAMNQLVARGGKEGGQAVRELLSSGKANAWQWMHGLWVLQRGGALEDDLLTKAAGHKDRGVRVHVQRVLSERVKLTAAQQDLALAGLNDRDPMVQRAAADALGQHPARRNVEPLLALSRKTPADDTHLRHVLRMALRDQLREETTLSAYDGKKWDKDEGQPRLLAEAALGVPAPFAADFLMHYLGSQDNSDTLLLSCVHHVARNGSPAAREKLLQFVPNRERDNLGRQAALFHEVEHGLQERREPLPPAARSWAVDLTSRLLASKQGPDVESGIKMVGELHLTDHQKLLVKLANQRGAPQGQRRAALAALIALDAKQNAAVLGGVLADARTAFPLRQQAAQMLAQANQKETRAELLKVLPAVPARLQNAIAVGLATSLEGGEMLLEAVKNGKASARLLQATAVTVRLKSSKLPRLQERLAELTAGLPPASEGMKDLLGRRRAAYLKTKRDPVLGAQVFAKNCGNCHQVGGQGAKVGPQLDGVGVRGLDRLLEDVLDPNRNVDQAFRLTSLTLKKGQVVSGLLLKEEGAVLVLADAQGKEVRVSKDDVEERAASQASPMPANFSEQIPEADFNNLLAYLLTLQSKPDKPGGK